MSTREIIAMWDTKQLLDVLLLIGVGIGGMDGDNVGFLWEISDDLKAELLERTGIHV